MKFNVGLGKEGAEDRLKARGISRREFLKFCGVVAAAMGMEASYAREIAAALTAKRRPSSRWRRSMRARSTNTSRGSIRRPSAGFPGSADS